MAFTNIPLIIATRIAGMSASNSSRVRSDSINNPSSVESKKGVMKSNLDRELTESDKFKAELGLAIAETQTQTIAAKRPKSVKIIKYKVGNLFSELGCLRHCLALDSRDCFG